METNVIFWASLTIIFTELVAIYLISKAISVVLKSDYFKEKVQRANKRDEEKKKKESSGNGSITTTLLLLIFVPLSSMAFAESVALDEAATVAKPESSNPLWIYTMLTINVVLAGVILYLRNLMKNLLNIDKTEEEVKVERKESTAKLLNVLTDTVAIEEEDSIDLGHDYDGIRELDNNLPPWWKWGFYLSIFVGILYLGHYHLLGTGDLQEEEYKKDIEQAELDIAAFLKAQAMNVDETNVTMLTDQGDIDKGQSIFLKYCAACHEQQGQGRVGPNLTDKYWIHGGRINDVFKTIKYGAANGMKSWKDELNPVQMQQVASFIKSLQGTTPPNPKEPEGELFEEEAEATAAAQE